MKNLSFEEKALENMKKNTEILEKVPIENTPFVAVKNNDAWIITWGAFLISPPQESLEDCIKYMQEKMWHVIAAFCVSLFEQQKIIEHESYTAFKETQEARTIQAEEGTRKINRVS